MNNCVNYVFLIPGIDSSYHTEAGGKILQVPIQ